MTPAPKGRRATAYLAELALRRAVAAADRVHDVRRSLFLHLEDEDGSEGWGECPVSALGGTDASTDASSEDVLAALEGAVRTAGRDARMPTSSGARAAAVLVEAASLDLSLRGDGRSLCAELGIEATSVGFAGVVGIEDPVAAHDRAQELCALGVTRLRVKVSPTSGTSGLMAVLDAVTVPVVADANGSLRPHDRLLGELADLPIAWLEQPFAVAEVNATAALAASGTLRVGLDESVTSRATVAVIARTGAAGVVCCKPMRLGLRETIGALEDARRLGLSSYVGGYFEAGLGRATLAALSTSGDLDGDVVSPSTYLEADPCALAAPIDGRQPLHLAPGLGPVPDVSTMRVCGTWPS